MDKTNSSTKTSKKMRNSFVDESSVHRIQVILFLSMMMLFFYELQIVVWPSHQIPKTIMQLVWSSGSFLWIAPSIFCTFGLLGLLMYRPPKRLETVQPIENLVVWRIVSRGINMKALIATIQRCQVEMLKTPLFPYLIEVITDAENVQLPIEGKNIRHISVPKSYVTPNKSLYKARALHYALYNSTVPDNTWIVHLDEETQPTPTGIQGICQMIREEESSRKLRIGQGAILYHREWKKYPVLTLADNIRTGIDFAQFHLQHRFGITMFGFHGSYIVVRNDLEKSIGFDFGPKGSITEDAFWGLVAMERGYRCRWVEGYLEEQSTQSVSDFVKQRRRWMQGLTKVVLYAPVHWKWKIILGFNTIVWNLGPFASLYSLIHFFIGFEHPWWIMFLANYSFSLSVLIYIIGLKTNLKESGVHNWFKKTWWFIVQIILFPYFSFLESLGVLAAVFRPVEGFHVVKK